VQRSREQKCRGRGAEVQRRRGGKVKICSLERCRGADVQRCRCTRCRRSGGSGADIGVGADAVVHMSTRCADVQTSCRCAEVQRWRDRDEMQGAGCRVQRCRGGWGISYSEVQRCRDAESRRGAEVQQRCSRSAASACAGTCACPGAGAGAGVSVDAEVVDTDVQICVVDRCRGEKVKR